MPYIAYPVALSYLKLAGLVERAIQKREELLHDHSARRKGMTKHSSAEKRKYRRKKAPDARPHKCQLSESSSDQKTSPLLSVMVGANAFQTLTQDR